MVGIVSPPAAPVSVDIMSWSAPPHWRYLPADQIGWDPLDTPLCAAGWSSVMVIFNALEDDVWVEPNPGVLYSSLTGAT